MRPLPGAAGFWTQATAPVSLNTEIPREFSLQSDRLLFPEQDVPGYSGPSGGKVKMWTDMSALRPGLIAAFFTELEGVPRPWLRPPAASNPSVHSITCAPSRRRLGLRRQRASHDRHRGRCERCGSAISKRTGRRRESPKRTDRRDPAIALRPWPAKNVPVPILVTARRKNSG